MWETIQEMAADRLWIYTGIAGALLGAAFLAYFKGRIGNIIIYITNNK